MMFGITRQSPHEERIGPFAGRWRVARKPFLCQWRADGTRCAHVVMASERYYDTREGVGYESPFSTLRFCRTCAELMR